MPSPRKAIVGTDGGEVVLHKSTYDQMQQGGGNDSATAAAIEALRRDFMTTIPSLLGRATAVAMIKHGA